MNKIIISVFGIIVIVCFALTFSESNKIVSSAKNNDYSDISNFNLFGTGGVKTEFYPSTQVLKSNQTVPSLKFGTLQNEFNYLGIWDSVQSQSEPDTQDGKYYRNLLKAYNEASLGRYMESSVHSPPQNFLAMHTRETALGNFLKDVIGNTSSDGSYVADLTTATKEVVAAFGKLSGSGSVYADNGKDGLPDGPFQVENGNPEGKEHLAVLGFQIFDVYDFRCQLNFADSQYITHYKKAVNAGVTASPRVLAMFMAMSHNRGEPAYMAYGVGVKHTSEILNSGYATSVEKTKLLYELAGTLSSAIDKYGIPQTTATYGKTLEDGAHVSNDALAFIILMREGWYIDTVHSNLEQGLRTLYALGDANPVLKLFPSWSSYDFAISEINSKYVKHPSEILNCTQAEFGERYGYTGNSFKSEWESQGSGYTYRATAYRVTDRLVEGYKDPETKLMQTVDIICAGYMFAVGFSSESKYIKLALEAGMPEEIDGSIIDPSKPALFYRNVTDSYNPMSGDSSSDVSKLEKLLGTKYTDLQKVCMQSMFDEANGEYVWGGGGQLFSLAKASAIISGNKEGKPIAINSSYTSSVNSFKLRNSSPTEFYQKSVSYNDDSVLKYYGYRMYDCSAFVSVGFSLGAKDSNGKPKYMWNSRTYASSHPSTSAVVNGREIDTTLYQVDTGGNILGVSYNSRLNQPMPKWSSVAKPGDILVKSAGGHVVLVAGVNLTGGSVELEVSLSRRNQHTIDSGGLVVFHTGGDDHYGLRDAYSYNGETYCLLRPKWNL